MNRASYNKSKLTLIFISFFWLLISGCNEENTQDNSGEVIDVESHKVRSQTYLDRGQFRPAIIEARNVIQKQPDSVDGYVLLAKIYKELGQAKAAIEVLENKAITTEDKNNDYWLTLANAYYLRGKYKSSGDLLDAHPEINDTHSQEYLLLKTKNALGMGRIDEAKNILRQLLSNHPDNIEAQLESVKIALTENLETGQEKLAELLAANPQNPDVLLLNAKVVNAQGNMEQAEDILTQILSLLPSTDIMTPLRTEVLNALSTLLVRQGRTNEALVYSRLLADAFPGANELKEKYELAITQYREGQLAESEATLKELLEEAPSYEMARQLLSVIKYLQGDFEASAAQFSENLDPETASDAAKHAFALSNMRLNRPEKVLEVLAIDIDSTDNPDTLSLYGAAAILSGSDETEKGLKALRKALELNPERTRIHLLLANHYNRQLPPDYQQALKELSKAYAVTPEDATIQASLVRQLIGMKEIKKATDVVQEVLSKLPEEVSSQLLAGEFYFSQKQHEKSQGYFTKALEIDGKSIAGFVGIIKTAVNLKQWQKAEQKALELIAEFPKQRIGYQTLLSLYQAQGVPEKAITKLTSMAEEDKNAIAAALLSNIYSGRGDFTKAKEYQKIAASLEPENEAFNTLSASIAIREAASYLRDKNYAKAREIALAGLNQSPDNERLIGLLVETEITSENYDEAEKIIQQTAVNNPYLANELNGDLSRVRGQGDEALNYYNSAWETEPSERLGLKIYTTLKTEKQEQRANKFLTTWINAFPDSNNALIFQSDVHLAEGNYPSAIKSLERVVNARPNLAPSLNNLAWAYFKVGDPRAEETAKRAYELAPNNGAIADTYGWVLYKQGKKAEAIAILKKAVELLPDNKEIKEHLATAMSDGQSLQQ